MITKEHATKALAETLGNVVGAGRILQDMCYFNAFASGWHTDLSTGLPFTPEQQDAKFPIRIALAHSELSEALEGHRASKMDDHLTRRPMAEVELADAVIRIFDLAGAMGYDLGAVIMQKLEYNAKRADHTAEKRQEKTGKKY